MKSLLRFCASVAVVGLAGIQLVTAQFAGKHTELNRWCGKPYQQGSPNYDPGGQTTPPPASSSQLLYLQVQPRYNIYVDSEKHASFLVSTSLTHTYGKPFTASSPTQQLRFDIYVKSSGQILVKNGKIAVNATQQEYTFKLGQLSSRMSPYNIVIDIISNTGKEKFTATTQLYYLPDKTSGSVVKVDGMYGGLLYKNKFTKQKWTPVLGVGFYTDFGFLNANTSAVQQYYDAGFHTVHPISPYNPANLTLDEVFDETDKINLLWTYDMRHAFDAGYANTTFITESVLASKDRESLLMWYTADEPDGWEYTLNCTQKAYDAIRAVDLYHPVSLVLNCYDFYYGQYSAGADIVFEDAYPIAINPTYSYTWGINCNMTYGDCGCDDCDGTIQDVSNRLDALAGYQKDLGRPYKPLWAVPQGFSDPEYWPRNPTPEEVYSMNGLAFNHNAKGLQSWDFPAPESIVAAQGHYASVVTNDPVRSFLLGANPTPIIVPAYPMLDVAYWTVGGQTLVSFVNGYNNTISGMISVELPFTVQTLDSQPWGTMGWAIAPGNMMEVDGASALEHSMVILDT